MRDISFGQYYPTKSFLHKSDPRMKLVCLIAYIVAIFLCKNFYSLGICLFAFLFACIFSGVPFIKILKTVKGILFILLFTVILNLFFYSAGDIVFQWKFIKITDQGIYFSIFFAFRLFLLVCGSSLLTFTTTPVSLTDGIESLLTPLKWIRFPVRELALIMSIALRFIPILSEETARIMNAQKARGADLESGNFVKRVKAMIPVLIPLLVSAFRRADELGDAMDARCYTGSKVRTKYKKLKFGFRDLIMFLFTVAVVTGVVILKIKTANLF